MNRLTAIGLASLVAYGLLITSKYTGVVSAARDDKSSTAVASDEAAMRAVVGHLREDPNPAPIASLPQPLQRTEQMRASPLALEFRTARDLKAFVDNLSARRPNLTGDERYHLAKALEECQFTTTINEDISAYSAKQRRQFMASLTPGDSMNPKRIAAYDAADTTQRCLRFQGMRISQKDIEDLFASAAQQGDVRAQARLLVAELNASKGNKGNDQSTQVRLTNEDQLARMISLLESRDPEAMMFVGGWLSASSIASQLHIGPSGETPEAAAFLGAFSLVACDIQADCIRLSREPQLACAYAGYCDAQTYEELYQNFLASPFAYMQAARYRNIIHTAINTQNWSLIGLTPKRALEVNPTAAPAPQR